MDNESKRKLIHISMGFLTVLLALVGREIGILIVCIALIFILIIARPDVWGKAFESMASREDERKAKFLKGPTLYIIMVLILVIVFDLRIAGAMFAMLAFGDGFANVIGSRYGRIRLESFQNKSLEGFLAFLVFAFIGGLLCFLMIMTLAPYSLNPNFSAPFTMLLIVNDVELPLLVLVTFFAAFVSACLELFTTKYVNDNISVPLVGALIYTILL